MGMPISVFDGFKAASCPFVKAIAACVTLGTGNSLGPEVLALRLELLFVLRLIKVHKEGSLMGLLEFLLSPSPPNSSSISLVNTTSMVILSAVIASVVSEAGLCSEPAFKCTSYMLVFVDNLHKTVGLPKFSFPIVGGLAIGLMALAYSEILYWGFESVDILLESRPLEKGLSADLLLQLVVVKIGATPLCRASGLDGAYYAPSLFIGAATGMSYGKNISSAVAQSNPILHISVLEVASSQAYGLAMAKLHRDEEWRSPLRSSENMPRTES
ncbi:chloride channel protein CLC-e-like [Pyrus ussuriensis x Pyrus communis]|uniref:Chloride channel protein CLC-e-like n=1 Tax=Pyrus ussuriensis x Pyrus communis TaxID=2448454 RepID=A0A5N5HK21_9ROSA|nr:chloride channel protein CLC-e-like [Pyrus ussuriensis x Pyrus communis]